MAADAADVPAKYKSEPWARTGVDVDHDFEPLYVISPDKKATVAELKSLLKDVDELYLATDGDREGEAIAWHLLETLKPKIPVRRMVFHEITESAIRAAADDPRDLDTDLVDAQETRRILDRLYGYEVSPVLWKKVGRGLSAGRVQSVATRIIVQRERERMAFRSASYWDILAELDASVSDPNATPPRFTARLVTVDAKRVATGRDFDSLGVLRKADEVLVLDEAAAGSLASGLAGAALAATAGGVDHAVPPGTAPDAAQLPFPFTRPGPVVERGEPNRVRRPVGRRSGGGAAGHGAQATTVGAVSAARGDAAGPGSVDSQPGATQRSGR